MTAYVALVRGINVGGRTALPMAALRAACQAAGGTDVATYIQSGNVVLRHPKRSPAAVGTAIAAAIRDAAGIDTPVLVRTAAQMAAVVAGNPYPDDEAKVHVLFCASAPPAAAVTSLDLDTFAPEELTVAGSEIYFHLPHGVGRAKLPVAVGKAKGLPPGTMRNWATTTKLAAMAAAL